MRIAYISSPSFADCDFPLVREWQHQGHEVYFFMDLPCYALKSNIINIGKQRDEYDIIKACAYPELLFFKDYLSLDNFHVMNRLNKKVLYPKNIWLQIKLVYEIRKINPDVVVMTGQPDMFGCILYLFRKKIVMTVHDPFPHTGEKGNRKMFFRRLAFKNIPKFVLLNGKQKHKFKDYWNLKEEQISVNCLGSYDCTNFFVSGIKNTKKYSNNVLFFGRISPYKGIEYLLQAMKIVHERIPNATVTIAGGGKMYFDITPYENLSYVDIQNHFIEMPELAERLKNSSVVVCPYTDATQSGVVLTAFSMNKPVIASNVGAMGEYIDDGKTGILVPPKDVDALANAIIGVLGNNDRLKEMENNIKTRNESDSDGWAGIARKYIEFFKQ